MCNLGLLVVTTITTLLLPASSLTYFQICWTSVTICSENSGDQDGYYATIEINGNIEEQSNSIAPSSTISSGGWTFTCSNCCYVYGPSSESPDIVLAVYDDEYYGDYILYSVAPSGNAGNWYAEKESYTYCTERIDYTVTELSPTPQPTTSYGYTPSPTACYYWLFDCGTPTTPTPTYYDEQKIVNGAKAIAGGVIAAIVIGVLCCCGIVAAIIYCIVQCCQPQKPHHHYHQMPMIPQNANPAQTSQVVYSQPPPTHTQGDAVYIPPNQHTQI